MLESTITMAHGSGGESTGRLIAEVFAKYFDNEYLRSLGDASVMPGSGKIAMTTDSFVVTPVEFPGGDIGRLAVCGTVNDLLMSGAKPRYLTAGFILEEGLPTDQLIRVVRSMAETAKEAGVLIVTGDTKVIEGRTGLIAAGAPGNGAEDDPTAGNAPAGGLMINTAGVGFVTDDFRPSPDKLADGDVILVSGTLGEHHAAILGKRMGLDNDSITSDNAPLREMVEALKSAGIPVHAMRDVTRGGLATVLNEFANASGKQIVLEEDRLPVKPAVRDFCGILGLDPLYMGNEGKMTLAVPENVAEEALSLIRKSRYGADAERIGAVHAVSGSEQPALLLHTRIGGLRVLGPLYGEGLPRIC